VSLARGDERAEPTHRQPALDQRIEDGISHRTLNLIRRGYRAAPSPAGITEFGKLEPCPSRVNSQGLNAVHDDDDAIDIDLDVASAKNVAALIG